MKFDHYLKKLSELKTFKDFQKKYTKAYLCAAFFVLDYLEEKHNEVGIDYYLPDEKKIMTFKLGKEVQATQLDVIKKDFVPQPITENAKLDLDQIKGILTDEMHNRTITHEIQKLIVILQKIEGKLIWNCTGFLSGLVLLKAHIEDESKSVIFMEKASLFDFIRPLPIPMQQPPLVMPGGADEGGEEEELGGALPPGRLIKEKKEAREGTMQKKKVGKGRKSQKTKGDEARKVARFADFIKEIQGSKGKKQIDKEKAEGEHEGFIG
jgi:hypothetical protein